MGLSVDRRHLGGAKSKEELTHLRGLAIPDVAASTPIGYPAIPANTASEGNSSNPGAGRMRIEVPGRLEMGIVELMLRVSQTCADHGPQDTISLSHWIILSIFPKESGSFRRT